MPLSLPYTIAILADIHGNLAALDAVLADLAKQPHDKVVIAGDLLANGPQPAETLARIQQLDAHSIYGNMDEAIVNATPSDSVVWWARQQIGAGGVDYLAALPFCQRITPPGGNTPEHDLLAVHASPRNVDDVLILRPQPDGTTFAAVTAHNEAAAMIGDTRAGLVAYGHIHYFSEGAINGQRIASIGSVGFPFDRDQRAAYALAEWDGARWQIIQRRIPYAYERVVDAIRRSGQPLAERYAQMILQAKWLPKTQFA
jgi:predicted phosphodiesterase